jgi:hypothetical protein
MLWSGYTPALSTRKQLTPKKNAKAALHTSYKGTVLAVIRKQSPQEKVSRGGGNGRRGIPQMRVHEGDLFKARAEDEVGGK